MKRKPYPTDLTDKQWQKIEPLIPPPKPGGRDRKTDMRELVNALRYLLRGGVAWRLLPHDFPPHGTVWWYYWTWRKDGTWLRIHDALREQVRTQAGKEPTPSTQRPRWAEGIAKRERSCHHEAKPERSSS